MAEQKMADFEKKIRKYCIENKLFAHGDHVLAGISGGADSVCMLLILARLQKTLGITLEAIHVEHGLRGAESLQDAAFVEELCERQRIFCTVTPVFAASYLRMSGAGAEETARRLRYEAFYARLRQAEEEYGKGRVKIAVAHNQNDQAETILFHLVRGSAIGGMAGMYPVRGNIVRPLLHTPRVQIERYLKQAGQTYRTDSTNAQTAFRRNRLRLEVFPSLEAVNARAVAHICRFGEEAARIEGYLKEQTEAAFAECQIPDAPQMSLSITHLRRFPELVQERVIYQAIFAVSGTAKDIRADHVRLAKRLMDGQSGKSVALPYHVSARREFGRLIFARRPDENEMSPRIAETAFYPRKIHIPGRVMLPDGRELIFRVIAFDGNTKKIPRNDCTKWYDYAKIEKCLTLRCRQKDDFFYCSAAGGKKTLKRYFIEEKIPKEQRSQIPLVAAGGHILWVVGHRASQFAQVDGKTKRVLEIRLSGGKEK